jgi:hypothetical protein
MSALGPGADIGSEMKKAALRRPLLQLFKFQRGQVAAQPCGPLSDEMELDCCDAREEAVLEKADVPLTAAKAVSANAIRRYFFTFTPSGIFFSSGPKWRNIMRLKHRQSTTNKGFFRGRRFG